MRKETRRAPLYLAKETLVHLTHRELGLGVRGGTLTTLPGEGWSDQSVCPTTTPSNCKPCN